MRKQILLCDFHIHSRFSDGDLSLSEVVDLFGGIGFNAIAITGHIEDSRSRSSPQRTTYSVPNAAGYFRALHQESRRALEQYNLPLIPGLEISNNTRG